MLNDKLHSCMEKYHDEGSKLAFERIDALLENVPIKKVFSNCFMIIKADALLESKVESIVSFLRENEIYIVDYRIKTFFFDYEKESLYMYKLLDGINDWYIRKKIFEIGPSVGLLVSYNGTEYSTIFEKIKSIKGKSNPLDSDDETIRRKFGGRNMVMNIIHSSDDPIATFREAELFFGYEEIVDAYYKNNGGVDDEILHYTKYFEHSNTTDFEELCQRLVNQLLYVTKCRLRTFPVDVDRFGCLKKGKNDSNYKAIIEMLNEIIIDVVNLYNGKACESVLDYINLGVVLDLLNSTKSVFDNEMRNWEKLWKLYDENQLYFNEVEKIGIQCGFESRRKKNQFTLG